MKRSTNYPRPIPTSPLRFRTGPRIGAFRNILIHGYAMVDDAIVWQVLTDRLPELERTPNALLASLDDRS